MWDYDEELIRGILEKELAPKAATVMFTAKDFSPIGITEGWQKETWYETEYMVQPIDSGVLERVFTVTCQLT